MTTPAASPSSPTIVYGRATGAELIFSPHALDEAMDHGLFEEDIRDIVNDVKGTQCFNYTQGGRSQVGYWNPSLRVFIATKGVQVITVIGNVTKEYVHNVKARRGPTID